MTKPPRHIMEPDPDREPPDEELFVKILLWITVVILAIVILVGWLSEHHIHWIIRG